MPDRVGIADCRVDTRHIVLRPADLLRGRKRNALHNPDGYVRNRRLWQGSQFLCSGTI